MNKLLKFFREWGLILAVLIIIAAATIIKPVFLSFNNIVNILQANSTMGIVSLGLTYVTIGSSMDLAVGSTVSLSAVITMLIVNATVVGNYSPAYAVFCVILAGILIGSAIGLINGAVIAGVNGKLGTGFLVTYGISIIIGALSLIIAKGKFQPAKYTAGLFKQLGLGATPVILFVVVAAILQCLLVYTKFGRHMYFFGANMEAARMAGIRTKMMRILSHVICGACAGLAGVLIVSRVNSASPVQGAGYELDAFVSVSVGGTSLSGGTGSILKTVLGVLVMGFLLTALNILGVRSDAQLIVRGTVIIIAVLLDILNRERAGKGV